MNKSDIMRRIALAEKCFTGGQYKQIVLDAVTNFVAGKLDEATKDLDKLPTAEQLFDALIEKLHGKSVYKTLKAIREGKAGDTVTSMTGLSSLMTHVLIEMKQGRREYGVLIPIIYEQLGKMVYSM